MKLSAHGRVVQVQGAADLVRAVGDQLPEHWSAEPVVLAAAPDVVLDLRAAGGHVDVHLGDDLVYRGVAAEGVARLAASRLELEVVSRITDLAVVHAGVVAFEGRGLVLPGASHSGKSTLVLALLRAGCDYLSDEYALLDSAGRVHPYPRRLTVRTTTGSTRVDASRLARVVGEAVPVSAVAFTRYEPGATGPVPVSAGDAVLQLVQNTVNVRAVPRTCLEVLSTVAGRAATLSGPRGDADVTALALIRRLREG